MPTKHKSLNILIVNGVNLDLLGRREKNHYGSFSLKDLEVYLISESKTFAAQLKLDFFQSNEEAKFLEKISQPYDGILLNPGAWTHTSLALADRLVALKTPFIEVHISNIASREEFRKKSYSAPHAAGVVYGFGIDSYLVALLGLIKHINKNDNS